MKIAFVNSCSYLGGAEQWHLWAATALAQRGHAVSLVLRRGPLADLAAARKLPVTVLPMASDLDLYSLLRAYRLFRRDCPDLILLNDQRECRIIAPAAALARVPVRLQRKGWPFLKGSWRDRIVYRRFVTHLMASSDEIARVFREKSGLPPERIRVLINGLDLIGFAAGDGPGFRAAQGIPDDAVLIGSTGRLVTQKGFDLLIAALAQLKADGLAPLALIAGEGPERDRLAAAASAAGVSDQVRLPGRIDDVPSLLAALDLFVFPSRQEGRSNALAEAMAAGRAIVATDIPGNDELIVPEITGLLVPPDDPSALAVAIARVLRDPALAARLGASARVFAEENLDAAKIVVVLEQYLEGLIREARS
jgi:glycosyltransferase involved in cell wall biosynthesis